MRLRRLDFFAFVALVLAVFLALWPFLDLLVVY